MSKLSDFLASGGSLKPFQDLGTVTGTVNLDLSQYGSFRVVQGAGDITLNVINADPDGAGVFELFFYRNFDWAVSFNGFEFVGNGYQDLPQGDMTALDYDGVSFSVAGQDGGPNSIRFNNDGTKLYMAGNASDSIYQYSLLAPFDLSTASYDNVSFSFAAQDGFVFSIAFNNNGTKLYMGGAGGNSIYQYSLSTAFDVGTMSYDGVSLNVDIQEPVPCSIAFNDDGTKMFVLGYVNTSVHQYTLTTAFSLSTASYDSVSLNVSVQDADPQSMTFNYDGSKLYIAGAGSDSVHQYSLSPSFDLSTASYDGISFSFLNESNSLTSIALNNDNSKLYMSSETVYQYTPTYDLGPPFTYPLTQIGNKVTLDTQSTDFSLKDAV